MSRVEERANFDEKTRITLLESDMDGVSSDVKSIKNILWTLVTALVVASVFFALNLAILLRS